MTYGSCRSRLQYAFESATSGWTLVLSQFSLAGDLFMATNNLPLYYSLENARSNLFLDSRLNYQHCLLTVNCNIVAIFKTSEGNFKIFDSHSRDSYGIPHPFGKCVQISVENINNLLIYFQNTVPQGNVNKFIFIFILFYSINKNFKWFIEGFLGHEKRKTSLPTWSDVDLTPSVCVCFDRSRSTTNENVHRCHVIV